ncbi:MAG: BamA/TamA family outer membrane protein [Gammaproteobacteria bacterium]|nr:BamA/TamA family outer membrane protein [Gammaproteobacteria bacterium]
MEKTKTFLWLILLLCSFTVEAVSIINNVRYKGNEITQASVLNREIYITPGTEFNEALIEKSRQAIMDLGLFKSVRYYLEEDYTSVKTNSMVSLVDVIFVVEEKYYLLVIPRLKINDEEIHVGLQLKWDNAFGLNHETRFLAEDRGTTSGIGESRYSFRYFYPNWNNSAYNIDITLQTENEVVDSENVIDRQDDMFMFAVSRWLNERGRNRGWFAGVSVLYQHRLFEDVIVNANSENIDAVVLGAEVGYININNYAFNRGGKSYGYKLDWSHDSFGSESEFTKHLLYYISYYQFDKYPTSNLNVQMQIGHSSEQFLGEDTFSLGSSDDFRGYDNNRFTGNTIFLTNFEYLFPQVDYPVIRYAAFIDIGNTYDQLSDIFHEALHVGAGFGLRWKIRAFVKLDLRADLAYGFEDEDYHFSFGTRHTF